MLQKRQSPTRYRRSKKLKKRRRSCHSCPSLQFNHQPARSAYLPQRRSKRLRRICQNLLWISNQSCLRLKSNQRRRRPGLDSLARKELTTIAAGKKRKRKPGRRRADLRKSGQKSKKKRNSIQWIRKSK